MFEMFFINLFWMFKDPKRDRYKVGRYTKNYWHKLSRRNPAKFSRIMIDLVIDELDLSSIE